VQRISLFFYRDMYEGLVGWVSVQEPSFSFNKSICTTDRCMLQMFSQLYFLAGKKGGKNKDCVGLYFCAGQESENGFSGFVTTKKSTKNHRIPTISFQ